MSRHDYIQSGRLPRESFRTLIMAAMRRADTDNVEKLRRAWPEIWAELQARYNSSGGFLPGEQEHRV